MDPTRIELGARLSAARPAPEAAQAPGAAGPAAAGGAPRTDFEALLAELEGLRMRGTAGAQDELSSLDRLDRAVEAAERAHGQVMAFGRRLEQAFRQQLGRS